MDRATLAKPLEDAERQVAQGKDYIAKQEAVIAELGRDGHGTAQARGLLDTSWRVRPCMSSTGAG